MRALELHADPLGAAIRARPPEPPKAVWIHVVDPYRSINRWCVIRDADPHPVGDRGPFVSTLCCAELPYAPVNLTTRRPHNTCPACETEIAAGTPGAGVAIDPMIVLAEQDDHVDEDAITEPRAQTRDLRPPRRSVDPPAAWDSGLIGSSALDHLNDLRIPEET